MKIMGLEEIECQSTNEYELESNVFLFVDTSKVLQTSDNASRTQNLYFM